MRRLSEAEVRQEVESLGYQYLGPYQGNKAPLPVICKCGCGQHLSTSLSGLRRGYGCESVTQKHKADGGRLLLSDVKQKIADMGYFYVDGEYIDQLSQITIAYPCGHQFVSCLARLPKKRACEDCGKRQKPKILRLSFEHVQHTFAQYGCTLLETTYYRNNQKLSFQCSCGCVAQKSYEQMLKTKIGCRVCYGRKMSKIKLAYHAARPKKTPEQRRAKISTTRRKSYATNTQFKISILLRQRFQNALKRRGVKKITSVIKLTGCSLEQLRIHLESLWLPGMTWESYGTWRKGRPMTWHIDHISPCASFDLTDPEQQKACFNYTNLQPLWAVDNMKKGHRIISTIQTSPPPTPAPVGGTWPRSGGQR